MAAAATHLIADDLGENGDAWLTVAYEDTLAMLGERLLVEFLMDEATLSERRQP